MSQRKCPNCQAPMPPSAKFCGKCGIKLQKRARKSKKMDETRIIAILSLYGTSELIEVTKESEYSKLIGTRTLQNFELKPEKIRKKYTDEQLKQIIEFARKYNYHPGSYAAITRACMDEDLNECVISGLILTEEELRYARMPRGLIKDGKTGN